MAGVRISGATKTFGDFTALHSLDLEIRREGEFLTLLGPSGCGKTTTLRLIAGLIQPTSGIIYLGDDDITGVAPQPRRIGMVFQDCALFPHMTVRQNIAFGLEERRYDKLLDLIRLPSGGQRQRIAVARAVAYPPRVLLMDEPLGALDLKRRKAMQIEIRRNRRELSITTVYVTYDQTEAMNMSGRIVVMNAGVIEQLGTAEEIYRRPASRLVADFVGQINLLSATVGRGRGPGAARCRGRADSGAKAGRGAAGRGGFDRNPPGTLQGRGRCNLRAGGNECAGGEDFRPHLRGKPHPRVREHRRRQESRSGSAPAGSCRRGRFDDPAGLAARTTPSC